MVSSMHLFADMLMAIITENQQFISACSQWLQALVSVFWWGACQNTVERQERSPHQHQLVFIRGSVSFVFFI